MSGDKNATWYARNRTEHNAKRKKKYQASPEARQAARDRAKRYREEHGSQPVGAITIRINGSRKRVYPLKRLLERTGIEMGLFVKLQRDGYIPSPTVKVPGTKAKFYTGRQIRLVQGLVTVWRKAADPAVLKGEATRVVDEW